MLKEIAVKLDDKREKIEDFIAQNVLQKWDNFSKSDDIRIAVNTIIINLVVSEINSYGCEINLDNDQINKLAKSGAKVEKKLNALLTKQLLKKSKFYKDRH